MSKTATARTSRRNFLKCVGAAAAGVAGGVAAGHYAWIPSSPEAVTQTSTNTKTIAETTTITATTTVLDQTPRFCLGGTAYDWLGLSFPGRYWKKLDPLQVLKQNGMDWNRVGVLIKHYPIGHWESWCSIEYAEEVMKASARNGMRLDLFFYLSPEGAMWGQQLCPPEWQNFSVAEKADALRQHTYDTTKYYRERGFNIEIYEIGNEIDVGILGDVPTYPDWTDTSYMRENIWNKEAEMLKGAIEGVRQADPNARILLHLADSGRPYFVQAFCRFMIEHEVPFDLVGLSYYPSQRSEFGDRPTLATLRDAVEKIASFGKKTLISEYGYPSSPSPGFPFYDQPVEGYPLTPEGQANHVADFLRWCYNNRNVGGVFYFYPENITFETEPKEHPGAHMALFFDDTAVKPALYEFKKFRDSLSGCCS
jgi:arabinogalactan endo-1,4-beta-galactosidase